MSDTASLYLFFALGIFVTFIVRRRRPQQFPPGPTPYPFIGNFTVIPSRNPWVTYAKWSHDYQSDLISVWEFGKLTILVNTHKAAKELFVRRSAIYSDRPHMTMIDLMGWDWNTALMPYSEKWRIRRRMLNQNFRAKAALEYRPSQRAKAEDLVRQLSENPDDFLPAVRVFAAATAMSVAYGHDIVSQHDRFVDIADRAFSMLSGAVFPGVMAVNAFPFLRHLPSWLPGTGFKEYARKCKLLTTEMQNSPWAFVKRKMNDGTARASLASTLMKAGEANGSGAEHEEAAKAVSAVAYAAGSDTTVSVLSTAILALLLHPSVVRRAQQEIDDVVGRDRLPDFRDRPVLPYVGAVAREVLRWQSIAPLGVPRTTLADDVYEGMFIPKGKTSPYLPKLRAMLHDPIKYPEPAAFKPERFLTPEGKLNDDDVSTVFGFGRRNCSGQHFADSSVWISIASILAIFTVVKAKDAAGDDMPVDVAYTDGMISHPRPFKCRLLPRDVKAEALVRALTDARGDS
ncbi:cytochrome P450 [Dentipellis sp. KUC8613]|nr:cytochrome P450 [Dentipellis sp. KUC8613]